MSATSLGPIRFRLRAVRLASYAALALGLVLGFWAFVLVLFWIASRLAPA